MAFTAGTYWEVETGGDDVNNAGGFDTGCTFATDGAATVATGASPVFTSAGYNFVAGDVGAWLFIKSGTSWVPGWYKIASVATNAATLSAAVGAGITFIGTGTVSSGSAPTTAAGCATTASPTSATWGIDYTQQGAAQLTFTDMVIDGTTNTKFTSTLNPVGKNFIGNVISVTSGTGFTVQRVAVVSTSGTTATCDKSLGTLSSTGGNGRMGGALASPGIACSVAILNNFVFIKSGTYSITSNSTNISGGALSPAGSPIWFIGYGTNRFFGNTDTQPVIQTNASTVAQLQNAAVFVNITFNGNSQTAAKFISAGAQILIYCTIKNFNTAGSSIITAAIGCLLTSNSAIVLGQTLGFAFCEAYANTATVLTVNNFAINCLAYSNTGATTDGLNASGAGAIIGSISVANGRHGFNQAASPVTMINCHAEGNAGYGYNDTTRGLMLINCSHYNNTSGAVNANTVTPISVLLAPTGSVFVSVAGNNFALNNLAGAGALLRQSGYFGYLKGLTPRGLTVALPDIGAAQSRVPWQGLMGGPNA